MTKNTNFWKDISFAVFILTHGRPDKVITYNTLRSKGYTGKIYLIVDDLDKTKDEYIKKYSNEVIVFDKREIAKTFDQGDNFDDMRAIIYARNASFKIAENLGLKYFIQLDDDYSNFSWRYDSQRRSCHKGTFQLDAIFKSVLDFFIKTPEIVKSIAFSQGGDFIGGGGNPFGKAITLKRKCMNSFFCSTDRSFQFIGRINEDVNTYTRSASTGFVFFTLTQFCLNQLQPQSNSGGMTELYLNSGTYVKSFYSVMYQPSSVSIKLMGNKNMRLHHLVSWKNTVPLILSEASRKRSYNK